MTNDKNIQLLQDLLDDANALKKENSSDPDFVVWKENVERVLLKIFGNDSLELKNFKKLRFFYYGIYVGGHNYDSEHLQFFRSHLEVAKKQLAQYIEEFKSETSEEDKLPDTSNKQLKLFISHSSKDEEVVESLIDLIEIIGVNPDNIFCSSIDGYGVPLGEDFLERIRTELDGNTLVLFALSENFYQSPICLCEMGATWVKTNKHIPILIPPFSFADIKGVIPLTQGFEINNNSKLNLFKEEIEKTFNLPLIDNKIWERKRNKVVKNINRILTS